MLGAGAVIESTGVSTNSITESVKNNTSDKCKEVIRMFDDSFEKQAIIATEAEKESGYMYMSLNFEDYYHLLDIVNGFTDYKSVKDRLNKYQIISKRIDCFNKFNHYEYILIKKEINEIINNIIYNYDKDYINSCVNINAFLSMFKNDYNLDIFNLNYDTLCEQSLIKYNDGFIKDEYCGRFDPILYQNNISHTVSHLHGCINYGFIYDPFSKHSHQEYYSRDDTSLHKFKNFNDNDLKSPKDAQSQSGEYLSNGNIITGLLKTEKIIAQPFLSYFNYFYQCLLNNDILIVIGYGCGDSYINRCLEYYMTIFGENKKMIFIDYIHSKKYQIKSKEGIGTSCYYALEQLSTTNKQFIYKDIWDKFNSRHLRIVKDYYYNNNKNKLFFTCGFSSVLKKYDSIIIDYVK